MQCHEVDSWLALEAADGLEDEAASEVHAHLAECERCRQRLAELQATAQELREVDRSPALTDPWLVADRARRRLRSRRRWIGVAGAAALLALLGAAYVFGVRVTWSAPNGWLVRRDPVTIEQLVTAVNRLAGELEQQSALHERDMLWLARALDEARSRDMAFTDLPAPLSGAVFVTRPESPETLSLSLTGARAIKKTKP